jgi:DNA-binding transcriptional MocR family regulator
VDMPNGQGRAQATLIGTVMEAIRARIASRALTPGARVPSIRAFAAAMKVSTSTVVEAYERLAGEGLITSRPGSGFYVAAPLAPLSLTEVGPRLDREVDPFWVSRLSLEPGEALLKPGCGWLPASWMPEKAIRRALRSLARGPDAVLADYGSPLGLASLRQLLARRLFERGVEAAPDQILLAESGTQAIDLLCRLLIEPGDAVLVDDPCYFNFHALLRAQRARIVSVPFTPNGPDVELFSRALEEHRPRLYITNSALHNPTGATLSPAIAHRILTLAGQFDLTIVEDDIFADFEEAPAPRYASFDGLESVVQIGSFSKTLSASVRCGYIAARPDWIDKLADLKIATSFGGGNFSAELVLMLLKEGSYRRHIEALRARLSRAREETARRLAPLGVRPWLMPRGGMFLWCRLPDGVDAAAVARLALGEGVVLAPGNVFSLSQSASRLMRFNVAQSADERIWRVLESCMAAQTYAPRRY